MHSYKTKYKDQKHNKKATTIACFAYIVNVVAQYVKSFRTFCCIFPKYTFKCLFLSQQNSLLGKQRQFLKDPKH